MLFYIAVFHIAATLCNSDPTLTGYPRGMVLKQAEAIRVNPSAVVHFAPDPVFVRHRAHTGVCTGFVDFHMFIIHDVLFTNVQYGKSSIIFGSSSTVIASRFASCSYNFLFGDCVFLQLSF